LHLGVASAVPVTITSNLTGRGFTVTGTGCAPGGYTTPQTLEWTAGASCTVAFVSPHSVQLGTQYVFSGWQDGNAANPRTFTAPAQGATYIGSFRTQYLLTIRANPPEGGTVSGGGWVDAGSSTQIAATPASGYRFVDWTGIAVTPPGSNPGTVTLSYGSQTASANFAPITNALPANYTVTPIATGWGAASGPKAINSFGQVTGRSSSNDGSRPFLWTPTAANSAVGSLVELSNTSGSPYEPVSAINDRGQVAVWQSASYPLAQLSLWSPATANGISGSTVTIASGSGISRGVINVYGQIGASGLLWTPSTANGTSGTSTTGEQFQGLVDLNGYGQAIMNRGSAVILFTPATPHGSTGTFTALTGLAGAVQHSLAAINEKGVVVGTSCLAQPTGGCMNRAFLWKPSADNGTTGVTTEIPMPNGFVAMAPSAMNGNGDVVGTMMQSSGTSVPFLYGGGTVYDLTTISGLLIGSYPAGINDKGQIVLNSSSYVYLATPMIVSTPVQVTITSEPPGITFQSEGSTFTTPHSFNWTSGTTHSVTFSQLLQPGPGQRLGFSQWLDGVHLPSRSIDVGGSSLVLTAKFLPQHKLTLAASPTTGGLVLASPPSADGFYNEGTTITIAAVPNSAYQFAGFSGDLTGSAGQQQLVMNSARSVTASFAPVQNPTLSAQIRNDVSRVAQPGAAVTASLQLRNTGAGIAKEIRITALSARIIAPAPGSAPVNKMLPLAVGDLAAGGSSGTISVPMTIPTTARRVILLIQGTVRNSAGRTFTFDTSLTLLR
jgi:hypothetical protein